MTPSMSSPCGRRGPRPRHDLRTGAVCPSAASARMTGATSWSSAGGAWAQAVARTRGRARRRMDGDGTRRCRGAGRLFQAGKRKGRRPRAPAPFDVASRFLFLRLGRLVEVRQVPAEEVPRALLHLTHPLAREAPLLAEVLQRTGVVLRQAVTQDVPSQLTHPLAHL